MSNLLRSLIVRVGADLSEFDKSMKKISKDLKATGKELTSAGDTLTKGITLPVAAAVTGLTALAVNAGKTADELITMSNKTGISTKALQEMQYAARFVDVEVETMTSSMVKLTKNMDSARGGAKDQEEAFKALGVEYKNADGSLKDSQETWLATIDALGKVQNASERDALSLRLFGKSAQELNPLIVAGTDELSKLADEAHRVGAVIDDESLAAMGEFDDTMQRLQATAQAAGAKLGLAFMPVIEELTPVLEEELVPALTDLVEMLADGAKWFAELSPEARNSVIAIAAFAVGIGPALTGLGKMNTMLGGLVGNLGKASKALKDGAGLSGALSAIVGPAGMAMLALAAVTALIVGMNIAIQKSNENIDKFSEEATNEIKKSEEEAIQRAVDSNKKKSDLLQYELDQETKSYEARSKADQTAYDKSVKAAESHTQEIIDGINAEKEALESKYDATIQQIQEEYGVVSTAAKSRSDIVIERYEAEADAARSTYDEKIKSAEEAYNSETEVAKQRYDEETEAAEKAYDILEKESKKRYDAEKKLAEDRYDEEIKLAKANREALAKEAKQIYSDAVKQAKENRDSLAKEAKKGYDADVKAARASYDERTDAAKSAYDAEIESAKKAHSEKMALLDAELQRSQDRIDRASSLAVGDLEDRIALLDGSTAEEVALERKKRQEQRAIELEGLIAAERDETEKAKLTSERTGIIEKIISESADKQLELQRWVIREQILAEKQKAADLKAAEDVAYAEKAQSLQEQLDEQTRLLTEGYNNQTEIYQLELDKQLEALEINYDKQIESLDNMLDETNSILENNYNEQLDTLDANLEETTAKRKTALETQIADLQTKLDEESTAHKTALDNQTTALDEQLKTQLESFQTNLDEKKAALDTSLAGQLTALDTKKNSEIAIIQEERIAKETAETDKYNAAKKSFDDQIAEHERMLSDQKNLLKIEYDEHVENQNNMFAATQKRYADETKALSENIEAQKKLITEASEKMQEESRKRAETAALNALPDSNVSGIFMPDPAVSAKSAASTNSSNLPSLPGTDRLIPMFSFPIPSYDVGTNYVPRDGLAMLHKGEAVVPAQYNSDGALSEATITINNYITDKATADYANNKFQQTLIQRGLVRP